MDLVKGCLSCLQSPAVLQHMSFVFHPKEKVDDLNNAMKDLMAKKRDIQRELDNPQNRGKLCSNQLERWLLKAGKTEEKVNQLLEEYSKGNCDTGSWFQNCYSRYNIGSEAFKLKEEITQLTEDQPEIKFTDIPQPEPVSESNKIVGEKIVSNLNVACSYLAEKTNDIIGIWGMGGVGKTTLLKKINQSLSDDDANMGFDHVLFIQASQNAQLKELREEIAKKLHLPSSAGQQDIFNALKTKKIVLLLDNIWEPVDLVGLGIINPYVCNNGSSKAYKYKVMFTTRSEDVCARMEASKRIKVECMEPDEAWALFKHNVNQEVIESDEKLKEKAWQVMNKCGGLPLALQVVGKAMSNRNTVQEWDDILSSLKISGIEGGQKSVLPILKLSYDNLPRDIQECFLCASILRLSLSTDGLLRLWMGLDLIGDFDNLQQAYGKARHIFKKLEESCLLCSSDGDSVSLHDVIYEMAVWIASDCGMNMNKWIVKIDGGMNMYKWIFKNDGPIVEISSINAENWSFANRVFISGEVEHLPILSHLCSDLLCLIIRFNFCFKNIPEGFFKQMPNLTYLNLQDTGIKELPKDIKCLVNLQYLNISGTEISSLPNELVYLKKLQYLICTYLEGLGNVKENLISRLQKLKVIDVFPSGWVDLEQLQKLKKHVKAIGMRVVSQEVFQQLSCLPITKLCLYNLDIISLSFDTLSCKNHGFLQKLKIESCPQLEQIVMNGRKTHLNKLEIFNVEKLQNIIWTDLSPPEFFHVLKSLYVSGCNLDNLAWLLHLPCLSSLHIQDCAEIETLFYIKEEREIQQQEVSEHHQTFPALEYLYLKNLPKFVSVSNFELDFPLLLYLDVHDCLEIETLFYIEEEREIQQQEVSEHSPTFPVLKSAFITKLPKLVSISNFAWEFPQLENLAVRQCFNLKKLPFKSGINDNNQRMILIDCKREWWESLEWDDATIPSDLWPNFYPDEYSDECTTSGSE
ncbi:probable disease resistance protein At1g61300 [Dioscorea cayenensis subsp. rotundata]|uniref:Probable disease resistance protein At1g61300 n=1 Tax=Dioscorea cayennensis subsp. rotundata TaxID=55577 RepID=A0AB40CEF9_DIOCR|nr:probable disease resistance protein At1g61300 [Dioscorea cayenensis subsp. rotundata]